MKTKLLLLFLMATIGLNAQTVNIPDPNFKNALLNHTPVIDTNGDGEIQVSEAEVTTEINVAYQNIMDLTGIGAFINITELNCSGNQLTQLNVSQNTQLEELICFDNQLTSLNVSQNLELEALICEHNLLTQLYLSNNPSLIYLYCQGNQLTTLDIRNGYHEQEVLTYNNPDLTCIFVDNANYASNDPNWYKDSTASYVETQAECDAVTGVEDFFLKKTNIYPNPVKSKLNIDSEFGFQNPELSIRNIVGKEVYHANILEQQSQFDLSHLSGGIYFLNIYNDSRKLLTIKLIKL